MLEKIQKLKEMLEVVRSIKHAPEEIQEAFNDDEANHQIDIVIEEIKQSWKQKQ